MTRQNGNKLRIDIEIDQADEEQNGLAAECNFWVVISGIASSSHGKLKVT